MTPPDTPGDASKGAGAPGNQSPGASAPVGSARGEPSPGAGEQPHVVDNRGMLCAQGIMRLMRALRALPPGQLVEVQSTDPAAEHDYPVWCENTGHAFLRHEWQGPVIMSYLRKRPE